jgi:MFS family permease
VRLPAVAGLALATGNNVIVSFTVLLATERHIVGAGAFFAVFAAALFAYRIVGRRLADRYERWIVAVPGYACMGLGLVIASLAHAFPLLAVTAVLSGIGLGAAQPALLALTVDLVPPERRGAAMATFYVAWELGSAASAIILGGAAQVVTYGGMFAIAGTIVLGTTVVLAFRLLPGARCTASVR